MMGHGTYSEYTAYLASLRYGKDPILATPYNEADWFKSRWGREIGAFDFETYEGYEHWYDKRMVANMSHSGYALKQHGDRLTKEQWQAGKASLAR